MKMKDEDQCNSMIAALKRVKDDLIGRTGCIPTKVT